MWYRRPEFTRRHLVARLIVAASALVACGGEGLGPHEQACSRGPVVRAEIEVGNGQMAEILSSPPVMPVVRFLDASGRPAGCVVVENYSSSPGGGTMKPRIDTTDADGRIRIEEWTVGPTAGEQITTFQTTQTSEIVRATLSITATPGPPASVEISGPDVIGYMGQTIGTVTASVRDRGSNRLRGVPLTFTAAGAKPALSATSVVTDADGTARTTVRLDTVGTATIQASVANVAPAKFVVRATGFRAKTLVMGGHRACAYRSDDRWFCWGYERDRPRGLSGAGANLTVGSAHVCSLVAVNGSPRCWGGNASGELGVGFASPPPPGYEVDSLGQAERPAIIGNGYAIFAGFDNTCQIAAQQELWCWGSNANGLLGNPAITPSVVAPLRLPMPIRFTTLQMNRTTACGIDTESVTYCWGRNQNGEIGDGTTTDRWNPTRVAAPIPFVALSGNCALTAGGTAYCWGPNASGNVGDGTTTDRLVPTPVAGGLLFKQISTGNRIACGLATSGRVYCWGDGQLVPREVPLPDGKLATMIGTAEESVCVVAVSDEVFCWGENGRHELGDGTTIDRAVPVPVMPAPLP